MSDQPPFQGDHTEPPRIALPKNIAHTLRYLGDADLDALRGAVEREWQRRQDEMSSEEPKAAPPARPGNAKALEKNHGSALPLGKASLIRASAQSGMKPKAIARTLRVSLVQVHEVLATKTAGKR